MLTSTNIYITVWGLYWDSLRFPGVELHRWTQLFGGKRNLWIVLDLKEPSGENAQKHPLRRLSQAWREIPTYPCIFAFFIVQMMPKSEAIDFAYWTCLLDFAHYSDIDNSTKTCEIPRLFVPSLTFEVARLTFFPRMYNLPNFFGVFGPHNYPEGNGRITVVVWNHFFMVHNKVSKIFEQVGVRYGLLSQNPGYYSYIPYKKSNEFTLAGYPAPCDGHPAPGP